MHARIAWGRETLDLEIGEGNLVPGQRAPMEADLSDPVQAMRDALEHPLDYPPLWRALTPDDHVAVVVDEGIPQMGRLLTPLLEQIVQAHVKPEAITLVCPSLSSEQAWLDDLPEGFQDVQIEVHQPGDRKKLAYLATTKDGRRIYLNRTTVDGDQAVLLTRRGYDPMLGVSGAETSLFPGLCDEATAQEFCTRPETAPARRGPLANPARSGRGRVDVGGAVLRAGDRRRWRRDQRHSRRAARKQQRRPGVARWRVGGSNSIVPPMS